MIVLKSVSFAFLQELTSAVSSRDGFANELQPIVNTLYSILPIIGLLCTENFNSFKDKHWCNKGASQDTPVMHKYYVEI